MVTWLRNLLLAFALFFSVQAHAYTVVSTSGTTVGSSTLAITIPSSTAGDTIFVVEGSSTTSNSNTTAPTDNKSDTYTKVNETAGPSNGVLTLWRADNVAAAVTSVTVTNGGGAAPFAATVRDYNGLSNPSVDVNGISAQITATNPTSPSVTTGFTNEVIIGYSMDVVGSAPTVGSGFGNFVAEAQSTAPAYLVSEDKSAATVGSYNATFVSGSGLYIAGVVGAKTPASVAGSSNHFLSTMGVGQ